jgi:hypothetical protein
VTQPRQRLAYAGVLAIVTPLGFATKFYPGPGADWVATSAGGFLYVLFWVFLILVLAPSASPRIVAIGVLTATSLLEVLQLWHPAFLERIRSTFLGHALLGSTFSGWDFLYYALAALSASPLARLAQFHGSRRVGARVG